MAQQVQKYDRIHGRRRRLLHQQGEKYVVYERRVLRAAQKRDLRNLTRCISFEHFGQTEGFGGGNQRRSHRKPPHKNKKTNEWEAYLKYEGDWERFCKKFTRFAEFEPEKPKRRGARRGPWHDWDFSEDEEASDQDDGWESDDPAFSSRKSSKRTFTKAVITIGERSDRVALGLPPAGSLTMEELKSAFRASALKWHPDRHEGSSKGVAEEKFKACGNAYRALCTALSESNRC